MSAPDRVERLRRVRRVYEAEEARAAVAVRDALAEQRTEEARLSELASYRDGGQEHRQRALTQATFANRYLFARSLDTALTGQRRRVDEAARRLADARRRWQAARARTSMLQQVIERRLAALARRRHLREQRMLDELAAQTAAARPDSD